MKRWLIILLISLASPSLCFASVNKTGGDYLVLMDAMNARGGQSTGGDYAAISSIGQRVSGDSATGGDYSLVSGMMGAVDTTPPAVSFSSPGASQQVTATFSADGAAFDRNGVQWILYVGGGSTPASWQQLAAGSTNQTSTFSFGSWDSTYSSGDYTFRLDAVDGHGNTIQNTVTFDVVYSFTITGTVPAFKWTFLGVPVEALSTDPISLFGNAVYKIYRWDSAATPDQYLDQYRYPDTLSAGQGFWIKSFYEDLAYTYQGHPVATGDPYSISLSTGWNQVSGPYNQAFPWGSVRVMNGSTVYSLADAAIAGLIDPVLYTYDYDNNSWTQNDATAHMTPQTGCYIRAYQAVSLIFDASNRVLSRRTWPVSDYSLNISARAGSFADLNNHIAATSMASPGFDTLDSMKPPRAPPAIEGDYIELYFPRDNWSKNPGRYANDTRPRSFAAGDIESWTFNVDTNLAGENATLEWDAESLPAALFDFTLVNVDGGDSVDMAEQGAYSYTAGGPGETSARFRIDVVKKETDTKAVNHTIKKGWRLLSIPMDAAGAQLCEGDGCPAAFCLTGDYRARYEICSISDMPPATAFWVYSGADSEIVFTGIEVDEASSVELLLDEGFNMFGVPFDTGMLFGDNISVITDEQEMMLSEAVDAGIVDGAIFMFNADSEEYERIEQGETLEAWKGYFFRASRDCKLRIRK